MPRGNVIHGDFLARRNITKRVKVNAPVDDFDKGIGIAGVIDILRAVAADAAINRPIRINRANMNALRTLQAALDFTA